MAKKWEERAQKLVKDLQSTTDNKVIERLAKDVVTEIVDTYKSENSRKLPLLTVRKAVETAFPKTNKETTKNQYFTNSGKGNIPRYQHLALKFLTFSKEQWDQLGDDARKEYQKSTEIQSKLTINDLKIEQLELNSETQQIVEDALNESGKSLAEFIQKACEIYGKTLVGKAKKYGQNDLTTVPTTDLLDVKNEQYKTHPKKIDELTKRAIRAIKQYNDEIATELNQKWFISGTSINKLTGSRVQTVNEILKNYETDINDHHQKHGLTAYTNRGNGRNIEKDIDLSKLAPDGLD